MREIEAAREAEERAQRDREDQLAHQRKMERLHERELELQLEYERLEKEREQHQQQLHQHKQQQQQQYNGPNSVSQPGMPQGQQRDTRGGTFAPPPPERTSSYDIYSKAGSASTPNLPNNNMAGYEASQFTGQPSRSSSSSALRPPEPPLGSKKSVSFDANLATEINESRRIHSTTSTSSENSMYAAGYPRHESMEYDQRGMNTPVTMTVTSGEADHFQRAYRPPNNHLATPISGDNMDPMRTPENTYDPRVLVGSTPGVVGAQEIYRDPRDRIAAQRGDHLSVKNTGPERLSFKDKMKKFAHEIGESTPEDKQKISSAQQRLENGQR